MAVTRCWIHQCERAGCRFRFPVSGTRLPRDGCPRCGARTRLVHGPFSNQDVKAEEIKPARHRVEALLDNIRSVFNVGSMFRTADASGIGRLHLCGITPTPENPKLAKTALGAEKAVPWTGHANGLAQAVSMKERGFRLWALEGGRRSESLFGNIEDPDGEPILLVVGNEVTGVDPGILETCERVLYIPMQGIKTSLNVSVAFGIAAYFLRYAIPIRQESNAVELAFR